MNQIAKCVKIEVDGFGAVELHSWLSSTNLFEADAALLNFVDGDQEAVLGRPALDGYDNLHRYLVIDDEINEGRPTRLTACWNDDSKSVTIYMELRD